ncbi:MAG: YidC/Oxa1 family membrane protein insertase [Patescibacteria group bacterium]
MGELFHNFIFKPILWLLEVIHGSVAFHDLGVAIIILTIIVRFVLLPLFYKGAKDQAIMQRLQPKIKEIQKTHEQDKEKQAKAMFELYKEHKVNPLSSIFLILIQLPIFIALFQILSIDTIRSSFDNTSFLGLISLEEKNFVLIVIAAALQYIQGKLALPKQAPNQVQNPMESMGKTMVFVGPILTIVILGNLPAALGLYWAVSTAFSIIQQIYVNKKTNQLNII